MPSQNLFCADHVHQVLVLRILSTASEKETTQQRKKTELSDNPYANSVNKRPEFPGIKETGKRKQQPKPVSWQ